MDITCSNCEQVFSEYLCDVPSLWRKQLVTTICTFLQTKSDLNCQDVKDCETLTSLSDFTVTGTNVCISYKDENGLSIERCFDFMDVLNASMNTVDPKCIASSEDWIQFTYLEKIQAIIDYKCACCE